MKSIVLALLLTASASAETIILPVQDLLLEHPNFVAPDFSLNSALNGQATPGNPPRSVRESKKQIERKLIGIMWDEYPDALSIRIWNGNMIVRMP
jgi:hypothetical protein